MEFTFTDMMRPSQATRIAASTNAAIPKMVISTEQAMERAHRDSRIPDLYVEEKRTLNFDNLRHHGSF